MCKVFETLEDAVRQKGIWGTENSKSKELIVFVHGYGKGPLNYANLLTALREGSRGDDKQAKPSDIYAFRFDANLLFKRIPEVIAQQLADQIVELSQDYDRLHIVGHSMGCLVLREAILRAAPPPVQLDQQKQGEPQPKESAQSAEKFANKLQTNQIRLTLLASTNRGFTPTKLRQAFAIEFFHRWYWLLLLSVVGGWWSRIFLSAVRPAAQQLPPSSNGWIWIHSALQSLAAVPGIEWLPVVLAALLLILPSLAALSEKTWSWCLFLFFTTPLAWAIWGVAGTNALLSKPVFPEQLLRGHLSVSWFDLAIIAWTLVNVSITSYCLGFRRGATLIQACTALFVACLSLYRPLTTELVWPATLLVLLPAVLYPFRTGLLFEHAIHGSSWITSIRLRWLERFIREEDSPTTVHIYGREDDLVGEGDHQELSHNHKFWQVVLQKVRHLDFTMSSNNPETEIIRAAILAVANPEWKDKLKSAGEEKAPGEEWKLRCIIQTPQETARKTPQMRENNGEPGAGPSVLVFLIHGIRDYADWQESLAARIREAAAAKNTPVADVVSVRYGYFSAFQFLFSGERERATRSFLDLYAQSKARYPNAECHVVAHSNGTYVVGSALLDNSFVKLKNLYLAGSVLQCSFDWKKVSCQAPTSDHGCVSGRIHSDRAAKDWPVGVLCLCLGWFRSIPFTGVETAYRFLGSGGVDGFDYFLDPDNKSLTERYYLNGPHGEALLPHYHAEIANFLISGTPPTARDRIVPRVNRMWRFGVTALVLLGLVSVVALFKFTILIAPNGPATWAVLTSALLTMFVVRSVMAV